MGSIRRHRRSGMLQSRRGILSTLKSIKWWMQRVCLGLLLVLYFALFLTLTIHERVNDENHLSSIRPDQRKFISLNRETVQNDETITMVSFSRRMSNSTTWSHGLVEGQIEKYLSSDLPLWEHSTVFPSWMKDYFTWHRKQRKILKQYPDQWRSIHYHLVECTEKYPNCGGTADRLGSLPYHVQFAASCRPYRLLLYHWTVPVPLECFLFPPDRGIDWRVPPWLLQHFDALPFPQTRRRQHRRKNQSQIQQGNVIVALELQDLIDALETPAIHSPLLVRAKVQSHDHGAKDYNTMVFRNNRNGSPGRDNVTSTLSVLKEPSFQAVFHDLWRVFFTPVSPIASKVQEQMEALGLGTPGSYIAIHLRLLYKSTPLTQDQIQSWTRNMIHCTVQYLVPAFYESIEIWKLSSVSPTPQIPRLLFASDSIEAVNAADESAKILGIPLFHRSISSGRNPLHLEKDVPRIPGVTRNDTAKLVNDLHDTFVDIYLIGMSRCVSFQSGGFGRWGSMLSYNASCSFFLKPGKPEICHRPKIPGKLDLDGHAQTNQSSLFLPPMEMS